MRSGVGLGPVPGLCLLAKRRERRFPEAGQSIAKPRATGYPKIAAGGFCGLGRIRGASVNHRIILFWLLSQMGFGTIFLSWLQGWHYRKLFSKGNMPQMASPFVPRIIFLEVGFTVLKIIQGGGLGCHTIDYKVYWQLDYKGIQPSGRESMQETTRFAELSPPRRRLSMRRSRETRDPTRQACDRGGLAAYDRFTVLWMFLSFTVYDTSLFIRL